MERRIRTLATVAALGLGALGLGSAQANDAADIATIEGIWELYSANLVAGDTEAWLDLWVEGGIQMPPGMPARSLNVLH